MARVKQTTASEKVAKKQPKKSVQVDAEALQKKKKSRNYFKGANSARRRVKAAQSGKQRLFSRAALVQIIRGVGEEVVEENQATGVTALGMPYPSGRHISQSIMRDAPEITQMMLEQGLYEQVVRLLQYRNRDICPPASKSAAPVRKRDCVPRVPKFGLRELETVLQSDEGIFPSSLFSAPSD
jgi:hypothetical protein